MCKKCVEALYFLLYGIQINLRLEFVDDASIDLRTILRDVPAVNFVVIQLW